MSELAQQLIVGAVVLTAVLYLVLRSRKKGCSKGDCGCDVKKRPLP